MMCCCYANEAFVFVSFRLNQLLLGVVSYPSVFTCVLDAQKDQLIETVLLSTICEMKKKRNSRVSSISFGVISRGQNCYQLVALGFVTRSRSNQPYQLRGLAKYCKFSYGNLVIEK